MYHIEIRRPKFEEFHELSQFFKLVIQETFAREGLSALVEDIQNEIENKKQLLESDLNSNGENRYFLIAIDSNVNQVIATIEYGPASELITDCTMGALKKLYEIGTLFVHPHYQRLGIATLLLDLMFLNLMGQGAKEFCLDSGYTHAQKVWKKKFGEPDYLFKNYWGQGFDHMIWRRSTEETSLSFGI